MLTMLTMLTVFLVGACLTGSYILFSRLMAAAVHVYICTAALHLHVSLMLLKIFTA